jgi:hypothetical protein
VLDDCVRAHGIEGRIVRGDGSQAVDVPVIHAERRGDQNGVVDLGIGGASRPSRFHMLGGNLQPAFLHCGRDGEERLHLVRDRRGREVSAHLLDQ